MAFTFRSLLYGLVFISLAFSSQAQTTRPFFTERGVLVGAGYGVNAASLPEGKYVPVFFIARFAHEIFSGGPAHQKFSVFFEPQVNAVVIKRDGKNGRDWEAGLNVGIQHTLPLSRKFHLYTFISTGPHFISVRTERQSRGFIFSDNMGIGSYYFVSQKIAVNTGVRIRHMSNANLSMPNHGINTINFLGGVSWFF